MLSFTTLAETAAITWGSGVPKKWPVRMETALSAFLDPHAGGGLKW